LYIKINALADEFYILPCFSSDTFTHEEYEMFQTTRKSLVLAFNSGIDLHAIDNTEN
jgi:hypothetical protein